MGAPSPRGGGHVAPTAPAVCDSPRLHRPTDPHGFGTINVVNSPSTRIILNQLVCAFVIISMNTASIIIIININIVVVVSIIVSFRINHQTLVIFP